MPTAAREPRGMLAAGSLRSPPMLKPAMTPERHPKGERAEQPTPLHESPSPHRGPLLETIPWQALPSALLATGLLNLPWQLGRHPWGMKGTFVDWMMLGRKALLDTKASYGTVQSNEGEWGSWQAVQRSCGHILSSATNHPPPPNSLGRLSLSKAPAVPSSAEFFASAAH